jgi:hypothetical protein
MNNKMQGLDLASSTRLSVLLAESELTRNSIFNTLDRLLAEGQVCLVSEIVKSRISRYKKDELKIGLNMFS